MNYTLDEYRHLCYEDNHKIVFDGYDYWWHSKKDKEFTLHCIQPFSDYKKAVLSIKFWLPKYKRLAINPIDCIDTMIKQLKVEDKIYEIANNKDFSLTKKVGLIIAINPNILQKELVVLLDVTRMTISRQIKLFKAK